MISRKYSLLLFAVFVTAFSYAQNKKELVISVFNHVDFYDGYAKPVSFPVPTGLERLSNTKYMHKLSDAERSMVGASLKVKLTVTAGCDNYDRIGRVTLYKTPKGKSYDDAATEQFELMRIMTPFTYKSRQPDNIPYVAEVDHLAGLFNDLSSDIWMMTEVFGTTGAGQKEVIGCNGSILTFTISVDLISEKSKSKKKVDYFPLLSYFSINGKDTTDGYNAKQVDFTLKHDTESAVLYVISSGHGAGENGEEYNWREHVVYLDGNEYTRIEMSQMCAPYEIYNTQPNGIYFGNIAKERRSWCPGAPVPLRKINLGPLKAGKHILKISIPDAVLLKTKSNYAVSAYVLANY
ncbi:peptide-N-glycosidase F-related protein [Pedobacter sp. MW01-1-1]|uniref:peptide-N-glycosidase F-related protein n=1 Tax=Pedobacter sp. MW01-1-1 TaxID=3383027 RepID=UPI003FEF425C